eukprot:259631_1
MVALTLFVIIAFKFVILSGQNQFCVNAFECVGTEWVLSYNQRINGYGYKSLFGPNTSITSNYNPSNVWCFAAFACAQISFINTQSGVYCAGSHACALSYINAAKYVSCYGSNSCQYSNIIGNETVECLGSQSCMDTNISTSNVYGKGAYSLHASFIDSQFVINDTLNAYFYGYQSGFGATVICRAGDMCNIHCYNNGCEMLYVECEENSNCNILLNNNDSNITIPPITDVNEYDYALYDIKYDTQILSVSNNELCDNAPDFVYDNYNEHSGIIEINEQNTGPVCCRGFSSCENTVSITFTDIVSDIVVCSAYASCQDIIMINTTKPVFCEGEYSCTSTKINKANNVYCLGNYACGESEITKSTNVYCLGHGACYNTKIHSNGNDINVYLFGQYSTTNIYCDISDKCQIHCGGYQSCYYTILHCNNNNCFVDCNTDTHCPFGNYTIGIYAAHTDSPTTNPSQSPTLTAGMAIVWLYFCNLYTYIIYKDQSVRPTPSATRIFIPYLWALMWFLF